MNFALSIKYDIRLLREPFLLEDVAIPYACKERQKAYNKEYRKEYYQKNKEKIKKRTYALKKKKKQEYLEWKSTLSCVQCGFSHPAALDFHHVIKKPDNQKVNELVRSGRYKAAYKEATERCIVLCSNCHRIHHWDEHNGYAETEVVLDKDD